MPAWSRDVDLCQSRNVTSHFLLLWKFVARESSYFLTCYHSFGIQRYSNWITFVISFELSDENEDTRDSLTQRSVVSANVIAGGELRCKGGFPYPRCTQHADFVSGHSFVARVLLRLYPWKLWRRAEKQKSFQTCGWLVSIWEEQDSSPDIFLVSYRHSYSYLFVFVSLQNGRRNRFTFRGGILILSAISSGNSRNMDLKLEIFARRGLFHSHGWNFIGEEY